MDGVIVDGLGVALMALDTESRIIRFNGPAEQLTGRRAAEVVGQACDRALKASPCDPNCPVRCALRTGTSSRHGIVVLQTGSLKPVTVEVTASALVDNGQIVGAVGLLREVGGSDDQVRLYGSRVFISRTPSMRRIFDALPKLASSTAPLLILGGRGSGRSALAETVHNLGSRQQRPLVRASCRTLDLSGEPGAPGVVNQASGGGLLLEDICCAPLLLQQQLLAWLEEGGPDALGIRITSTATGRLTSRIEDGTFRRDLYYRLNVLQVALPSLAERVDDIPLLAQEFVEQLNAMRGTQVEGVSIGALRALIESRFSENIRGLKSAIDIAHARCAGPLIEASDLPRRGSSRNSQEREEDLARMRRALREAGGNMAKAARSLGIHRTTLWRRVKRHRLDRRGE